MAGEQDSCKNVMDTSISVLSEEILLKIFGNMDKCEVIAAAGSCRHWRSIIRGSHLMRDLIELHYPSLLLLEVARNLNNAGLFDLFLRTERLRFLADETLRERLTNAAESIRESDELIGLCCDSGRDPYVSPTSGTSATAVPNASGCFDEPVYFDWRANWHRVAELVETEEVQRVLMSCIDEVADGYYYSDWDEETIWPFLFMSHRRYGNGEQDYMMNKFLSPLQVRELNGIAADQMQTNGETYLSEEYNPKKLALQMISDEVEEEVEEDAYHYIANEMVETLYENQEYGPVTRAAEEVLYNKNGPVKDILLCTMGNSYGFMPLNYILAKLVSPEDAELKLRVGREYSVVVDEQRNIVFDNNWYFLGIPATEALERSRIGPLDPSEFDYSLGGLVS